MIDLDNPPVPVIKEDATELTLEQLRSCVPLSIRKNIKKSMVDLVNSSCDDIDERNTFRENILTFANVLQEGKWKFEDYICAVKYVSHKLLGDGNTMAWAKVFPNRYQRLVDSGASSKTISAHTSQYNGTDLVSKIIERTLTPIWVANCDILQEAINTQAQLMRSAKSETVRHKAAANLIENLKKPESVQVDISVGVSNDTVEDLRNVTRALALQQQKMIAGGHVTANDIAGSDIIKRNSNEDAIEAEFEEIEDTPNTRKGNLVKDFYR